jgi:ribonuclease P protein component
VPKHGHTIVSRNLVRRRLREALRMEVLPRLAHCGAPLNVLVRARRDAYGVPFAELRDELISWTEKRCSRVRSS